ncbi:MAG: DUF1501 domain-containing protein [Polyangiaceae bacterium]|nr:DUF1501 domain-containing protein [Polyangiaceae bacterium]
MTPSRRSVLQTFLFGAGAIGLRSLATGLPIGLLADPRRALAADGACLDAAGAQFLVLSTSGQGDPLNANAPGAYADGVDHPDDPAVAKAPVDLGGKLVDGAKPWALLPASVRSRACFFHHATQTNNHSNQPKVMRLMGHTKRQEMLVSIFARQLAPCLQTVQAEPVVVGAVNSNELLSFEGRTLPRLSPRALRDVLSSKAGPLADLRPARDRDLDRLHALFKAQGTNAQRQFLDRVALSREQARAIPEALLDGLSGITSDDVDGQIVAAAALIKMKVAPVVSIHIPFGGDNHRDPGLADEAAQTVTGVASIGSLMQTLADFGLSDQVTFASINVFGRSLLKRNDGRSHHADHHVAVLIGRGVRGGVVGGLARQGDDYVAQPIDSASGAASPGGDVPFAEGMSAMAKTLGRALGVPAAALDENITGGKVVPAALI